jgi:hypothetical protein
MSLCCCRCMGVQQYPLAHGVCGQQVVHLAAAASMPVHSQCQLGHAVQVPLLRGIHHIYKTLCGNMMPQFSG